MNTNMNTRSTTASCIDVSNVERCNLRHHNNNNDLFRRRTIVVGRRDGGRCVRPEDGGVS